MILPGFPPGVPLSIRSEPLLVLGGEVITTLSVTNQVDFSKSSTAQLLDHPVLGPELTERSVNDLHCLAG